MNMRYGGDRVRRGLIHFGLGKVVSAGSGFVALILVVRALSVAEFADYSVLVALIELITAFSGFGITHALLRYVPELYGRHHTTALRQFVLGALVLRSAALLAIVLVVFATASTSASLIGLSGALEAFKVYLLVVVFRISSHFFSQILESTLHQAIAQIGFSATSLLRLAGMIYLTSRGAPQLVEIIWVEVLSDAVGMLIMLAGVGHVVWRAAREAPRSEEDAGWLKSHLRQIVRFALSGFAQHLVGLPFGGNTNRLVGGRMFSDVVMANFGFAHSIYEYVKRYLPAQLLVGLVRPVVVARYSEHCDFPAAARTCQGFALINMVLIGAIFSGLVVGGEQLLTWVSSGKYGMDAVILLAVLLFVLALETQRLVLEMLSQTVERYAFLIPSNLLLSLSIVPAILMFPYWGALGFPLINALALVISNIWVKRMLSTVGHNFAGSWPLTATVGLLTVISIAVGQVASFAGIHWLAATLVSQVIFAIAAWKLCGDELKVFLADLMGPASVVLKENQ